MSKIEKMPLFEARQLLADIVIRANIPGLNGSRFKLYENRLDEMPRYDVKNIWGLQSYEFEQAWGVSCRLNVEWEDATKRMFGKSVKVSVPNCKISWSSTGRDLVETRAAIKLYTDVLDLACLIEVHFGGHAVETSTEAYERRQKIVDAEREVELAEILKEERWVTGYKVEFSEDALCNNKVPKELWTDRKSLSGAWGPIEEGETVCGGTTSGGTKCKSKGKVLVWNQEAGVFLVRCNRHLGQEEVTNHDRIKPELKAVG